MENPPTFEFVIGNKPEQLKGVGSRRLKSHLSKRGWQAHRLSAASTDKPLEAQTDSVTKVAHSQAQRRRRKSPYKVTYELSCHLTKASPVSVDDDGSVSAMMTPSPPCPSIEHQLGGGRIDPFRSYPRRPFVGADRFIDHYIVHMAVDIPELDGPDTPGLLRSSWFPLVISEPACFDVIMLLSASNYVSLKQIRDSTTQLLQLKSNAIENITFALATDNAESETNKNHLRDGIIGAVAKMASFEAVHGDVKTYSLHMKAVQRMVEERGGLENLGLDGLLRRIVIWIDLNGAFLLGTERFFPGQYFSLEDDAEPNPIAFTAPGD